jgi:TRAP-type C4-dicarboxylate transport system permease small subunit
MKILGDSFMKKFWTFFDKLLNIMAVLAGAILVFITAAVCYTIGMRFLFTKTTIWIIPVTEYALLWIVFLATAWLLREKGHITTDVLYAFLNQETKLTLDCIIWTIGGLTCAGLFFLGVFYMVDCMVNGVTDVRAITVPKSVVFSIVPIGSILLTFQFFRMAWSRTAHTGKGN